ncbi:MAG: HEAT repeat domain-containing protein [Planctomycetota bacterium]
MRIHAAATALAFVLIQPASAHAAALDVRPRPVRWHLLPRAVTGAFVGRGGRCFYHTRAGDQEKPVVRHGVVEGGFRPILLDRSGRLWCIRPGEERLFGVKGDDVVSATPPKRASFHTLDRRDGLLEKRTAAWEDAAGRIWFGHSRGVQWTDGRRWHTKDLAHPDGLEAGTPMSAVYITEDAAGTLYFWAPGPAKSLCGTKGFWAYDGKTWRQMTGVVGLDPASNRIAALCLIGPERLLVNTEDGRIAEFPLGEKDDPKIAPLVRRLNDPRWAVRKKATADLIAMGPSITLPLKRSLASAHEPETRSRIRMVLGAPKSAAPRRRNERHLTDESPRLSLRSLKSGRGTVTIRPRRARRRETDRRWVAVLDRRSFERARLPGLLLLLEGRQVTRMFEGPKGGDVRPMSILDAGAAGVWIGIRGRGLVRWDGKKHRQVLARKRARYWRILGRDRRGRILLTDGDRVGAYWPGKPENPQKTGDAD